MPQEHVLMISVTIEAPLETVWRVFTDSRHMMQWYGAMNGWKAIFVENDLVEKGIFRSRMERNHETELFEVSGTYEEVLPLEHLRYRLKDGRQVEVMFIPIPMHNRTKIIEIFESDHIHDRSIQHTHWQKNLDCFAEYVEKRHYKMIDLKM